MHSPDEAAVGSACLTPAVRRLSKETGESRWSRGRKRTTMKTTEGRRCFWPASVSRMLLSSKQTDWETTELCMKSLWIKEMTNIQNLFLTLHDGGRGSGDSSPLMHRIVCSSRLQIKAFNWVWTFLFFCCENIEVILMKSEAFSLQRFLQQTSTEAKWFILTWWIITEWKLYGISVYQCRRRNMTQVWLVKNHLFLSQLTLAGS